MRRITAARIAVSRWLSRRILGRDELLCAHLEWRQHWARHAMNALFLDRGHCNASAAWEARQAPDPMAEYRFTDPDNVAGYRASGLL